MPTPEERLARIEAEIRHIKSDMTKQDEVLDDQSKDIKKLLQMADKSSGALFMLMGAAGFVGALISNALDLIKLLAKLTH